MAQYILFAILVVLTPFVVVTRYLQGIAHIVSHLKLSLFGFEIPYVLILAGACLIALLIWQFRNLTRRKILSLLVIVFLILLSHQTMDMYLQMSFFDLQQNWHYFAYGAYAFFFFRAFNARKMPKNKMILYTYFSAISISCFDEAFQYFMSDRVFDISDIVKDSLGVFLGLLLVLFVTETYGTLEIKGRSIAQRKISNYFRDPLSALVMLGVLTVSSVLISPLLTDHENWFPCIVGCLSLFVVVMAVIHFSQFKIIRRIFIAIFALLLILLSGSFLLNHDKNITHNSFGLSVYKGIPIPFYDAVIFPDGTFRLADKKHRFSSRDQEYFLKTKADILLVGSGSESRGGKGFDINIGSTFIFNPKTIKGMQLIILPTPEACEKFNQLRKDGKSVVFVLHNTC